MDFEEISNLAFQKKPLESYRTILEQLIWYKMKDIYEEYRKGESTLEESQIKKNKVCAFYKQELRIANFEKERHDERYKNIRESEQMLKEILNNIKIKKPEKEITKQLIEYVTKITGIVPIKTEFENNYEVN